MIYKKKGQVDYPILTFVVIVFGLLLLAPIILKMFTSVKTPISAQLGNVSGGAIAKANFDHVMNTGINFWDKIIVAAFFFGIVLLVLSALFIDSNPFWVILYIVISFMVIVFAPDIIDSLDAIYESPTFVGEVAQLTFMDAIRTHFGEFLVGIMVFTGIIIYGKIVLFKGNGGRK